MRVNKVDLLNNYDKGYSRIKDTLNQIPREVYDYKPTPTNWSIREVLVHVTDSEANSYVRIRTAISESGNSISSYDQEKWAIKLLYEAQNIEENLELFRYLRKTTYQILKNLPDEVWSNSIVHPERGKLTLLDYFWIVVEHIDIHVKQILRNYETWQMKTLS